MSEITFDQIKAFQDQLDQHPASGALGRAVQNVGPQAASRETMDGEDMKPVSQLIWTPAALPTRRKAVGAGSLRH